MLTLEKCHQILNKGKTKYTKDQVIEIRKFLYKIAEIEKLNSQKDDYRKKGNFLH